MLEFSIAAFTASFLLIFLAEMGDKTQFLAMSLATRYNVYKVLYAISLATVLNFGIVVIIGQFITSLMPLYMISLAASLSFIGFGLWTLKTEKPEEEVKKASKLGIIGAASVPFFIAEFGDKTELAAISLAADYQNALSVLIGATLAMLVADGIGIAVGIVLGRHFPEKTVKWVSAAIFIVFGLMGTYEVLLPKISFEYTALALAFIAIFCILTIMLITRKREPRQNRGQLNVSAAKFTRQDSCLIGFIKKLNILK
ncbi:MAG TPA: TMEM165/GDT1 family protein [Candidatus Limnocylindrales bacterium]|nr:TMEM165/GDT1 family protein [Candidatus Limnocylindrales bacterium]